MSSRLSVLAALLIASLAAGSAPARAQQIYHSAAPAAFAPSGTTPAAPSVYTYYYNGKPFCTSGGTGKHNLPLSLTLPPSSKSYNYALVTLNIGLLYTPLQSSMARLAPRAACPENPAGGAFAVTIGIWADSTTSLIAVGSAGSPQLPYEGSFTLLGFVPLANGAKTEVGAVWESSFGTVYAADDGTTAVLSATLINCSSDAQNCKRASAASVRSPIL
jgi:hypothetical protein